MNKLLDPIKNEVLGWQLNDITGEAYFSDFNRYGYIAIKLALSDSENNESITWIDDVQIPIEFREGVNIRIQSLLKTVNDIRKENLCLKCTVFDGSYHPTNSHPLAFSMLALHAFRDCFKETENNKITPRRRERIEEFKELYDLKKYQ